MTALNQIFLGRKESPQKRTQFNYFLSGNYSFED